VFRSIFVAVALSVVPTAADAGELGVFKVGVSLRKIVPPEPYEWRGTATHVLNTVVWYPAASGVDQTTPHTGTSDRSSIFEADGATLDAALASGTARFPVVLLSHGNGGTAQSLGWFAAGLAANGYIVAGVNHPGNSALEPKTVQGSTLWPQRARDLSVVLDALFSDTQFAQRLDPERIGAAGYSLGGYTVIALAGGIAAPAVFGIPCRGCKPPQDLPDLVERTEALQRSDPAYAAVLRQVGASVREPRVRAVLAIAPGLVEVVTSESLAAITLPVAIVAGASDAVVPPEFNAKVYAARIPGARLKIFPGGVGHFTFLNACTAAGRGAAPQFCVDAAGVDRKAIHNATILHATEFFNGALH
jgi:predicted dienelactone hydrolase